jgi:putative transposase
VARPLRLCFADARYHVIARSTSDGVLFADEHDRERFIAGLGRIVDRHRWICHAYCLMSTHYHLVIETPLANLPVGMQQLNGEYASRSTSGTSELGMSSARATARFSSRMPATSSQFADTWC